MSKRKWLHRSISHQTISLNEIEQEYCFKRFVPRQPQIFRDLEYDVCQFS